MQNYENKNFLKELGQRVKSRRLDLGLSQEELAQRCNYAARSSINRLEQGLLDIPQSKVMAVAKALDVTPAFLMGWEEEVLMTVGDRIKNRRCDCNIPQNELAQKVGITKQTLYKYEKNIITNIPSDEIELIAKALETTPAYLMGWEDENNNPLKVVKDDMRLTGIEKLVITSFREADEYTQGLVIRSLGLDKEIEEYKKEIS